MWKFVYFTFTYSQIKFNVYIYKSDHCAFKARVLLNWAGITAKLSLPYHVYTFQERWTGMLVVNVGKTTNKISPQHILYCFLMKSLSGAEVVLITPLWSADYKITRDKFTTFYVIASRLLLTQSVNISKRHTHTHTSYTCSFSKRFVDSLVPVS